MFYSATSHGFFHPALHSTAIPPDAVEITDEEYIALLAAQSSGQVIEPDAAGRPVAVMLPPPTEAERRAAWRQGAYLDRARFVRAIVREGVLPPGEAITAAKGDWPPTFAAALEDLPVDPLDAQIDWAAASGVARLNPLFLAVLTYYATAHSLTAEQAEELGDTIFGWGD